MDRCAAQAGDLRYQRDFTRTPFEGEQSNKMTPILFVERRQYSIDRLVLLCNLTMRMLLTSRTETMMDAPQLWFRHCRLISLAKVRSSILQKCSSYFRTLTKLDFVH